MPFRVSLALAEVLKQEKVLKDSLKFKNVFYNKDLTLP